MAEEEGVNGGLQTLTWQLQWSQVEHPRDASEATLGVLTIAVGDDELWGSADGDWPWIDLLRWLGRSWAWLRGEEGMPAALQHRAHSMNSLIESLQNDIRDDPPPSRSRAEMSLWNYRETHDLSRALAGASAPTILVWRDGLTAHILTDEQRYTLSWPEVLASLTELGDTIASRLVSAREDDAQASSAADAWKARDSKPASRWLRVARLQDGPNLVPLSDRWNNVALGEIETSPILAAARMTSRLEAATADRILELIDELPYAETSIGDVSANVLASLSQLDLATVPYEQAYLAAQAFRASIGLADDDVFYPERWLTGIGVLIRDVSLRDRTIEAIGAWGPRNGPAILINVDGAASSSVRGRNASLAHEIGHLVLDRATALPAAEVLGGKVDPDVERRARAFAAELLLPRAIARDRFAGIASIEDARRIVGSLTRRYVVSREIVAWQARNSGVSMEPSTYEYLRTLVSRPGEY